MGRNLPFLPSCGSPSKTLSFRAATAPITAEFDDMFATGDDVDSSVESVIRGLSTDRFFFNPGKTSSILEEAKPKDKDKESVSPFKESVSMMEMESTDPFVDFKKSMQEMVEADEGLKEWENLQELLSLYLAVNDQTNHGYIIGAFVDLLLPNLDSPSSSSKGQEKSLLVESSGSSCNRNRSNNNSNSNSNSKLTTMTSSESPESTLSFTSSFASSSSGICSSTSHCLSSCSLEDDEDESHHGDDEDDNSPQKASVSVSDYPSIKV